MTPGSELKMKVLVIVFMAMVLSVSHGFAKDSPKVLRVRFQGEIGSLDWNANLSALDGSLIANLMEGLIQVSPELKPAPSLAAGWEISPDRKTYTFHLKPGVRWADGVSLKAQHFVDSWRRLLSPVTASRYAYLLFDIVGAAEFSQGKLQEFNQVGVKVLDDLTFQVQLKQPISYWLWIPTFWATYPIRKDLIDLHGNLWTKPGNLVTLGQFSLTSHDLHQSFTLTRSPTYYGARGNLDEVQFELIPDDKAAIEAYLHGRIDFVNGIPRSEQPKLEGRKDFYSYPALSTFYLRLNHNRYPLTNPRIRRAIAMAIDHAQFKKVFGTDARLATTFVPPPLPGYSEKSGIPYNPSQARRELNASGVLVAKHPLDFVLVKSPSTILLAQAIQTELKNNLGIQVNLRVLEAEDYYKNDAIVKNAFMILDGWSADYPDPDNFYSVFLSSAGTNKTGWKNAAFDQLVLQGKIAESSQRNRIYQEADEWLVSKDVIIIPLLYLRDRGLLREWIRGFRSNPLTPDIFRDLSI
jgi:oligopeptide transport system substrate-binding protein